MRHLGSVLLVGLSSLVSAQNYRTDWFPFVIPTLSDGKQKSPMDLSFLSPKPAGSDGFVRAVGEQLVDGKGKPIRFFGTNICDLNVMPPKEYAPRIATRLKELGVNFVRLHYYDYTSTPDGIFNPDKISINSEKLDQMDFLIHHLIENGVYVDLNLHVARNYPGLPDGWDPMGKGLDRIDQRLIHLQKQFAKEILTHKNPYRRVEYRNEPGIAFIEINNENSMLGSAGHGRMAYSGLPEQIRTPIQDDWNAWLTRKYRNTEQLNRAWSSGLNLNLSQPPIFSSDFSKQDSSKPDVEASSGGISSLYLEKNKLVWDVRQAGAFGWAHQLHYGSIPVKHQESYVFSLKAKANRKLDLSISIMMQQGPWETVAGAVTIPISTDSTESEVALLVSNPTGAPVRLSISTNNQIGRIEFEKLQLKPGSRPPLSDAERLENRTVKLGKTESPLAAKDYFDFVLEKELAYTETMTHYIKSELKAKQLVWDTQVNYGGKVGIIREAAFSDVIDIHSYPNHPTNAGRDEKGNLIWYTKPFSMVENVSELERNPLWRLKGKPFFMSEFDLNPPNEFNNESYPLFTMLASFQGWSGLGEYSWLNFSGYEHPKISSAFATVGNPAQIAWMPFSALIFRLGLIEPTKERMTLGVSATELRDDTETFSATTSLWKAVGVDQRDVWSFATDIQVNGKTTAKPRNPKTPFSFLNGNVLQVENDFVGAVFGRTSEQSFKFKTFKVDFLGSTMGGYANFGIVPLDGKPLSSSKKMLITTVSRAENKGMKYNDERSSVGGDWGEGPALMEPVKLKISFDGTAPIISEITADGKLGKILPNGNLGSSAWYLVERK